jgi:hypothetical protein
MNDLASLSRTMRLKWAMWAVLIALSCVRADGRIERVALVIGNNAYADAPLDNPTKDARAVGEALRKLGFTVVEVIDADKNQMEQAIAKLRDLLKGRAAVGMLYYAGHAIQLDWHNYLIPVDAKLSRPRDVATQTVDVQVVLDAFKDAGNRLNIVVLDACRDNPFGTTGRGYGLAPLDAPRGTFLAYSTAPGNVADDGTADSGNSLYTASLVKELIKPNSRIEDVFKRVRLQVRQQTEGRQVPWESTSLEDEFFFDRGLVAAPSVETTDGKALLEVHAKETPEQRQQSLNAELAEWDRIKNSRKPDDFFEFLKRHPSGFIFEKALFQLDQLQEKRIQYQPAASDVKPLLSGRPRYAKGDVSRYVDIDGFNKDVKRPRLERVTYADDNRVLINGGQRVLDQMGSIVKDGFGDKDPAVVVVPAEVSVGLHWRTAFRNVRPDKVEETVYWDFHVVGQEYVDVPAGRIRAYKIVGRGDARFAGGIFILECTNWIDPTTMLIVRSTNVHRSNGRVINSWTTDLVSHEKASDRKQ